VTALTSICSAFTNRPVLSAQGSPIRLLTEGELNLSKKGFALISPITSQKGPSSLNFPASLIAN